MPRPTSFRFSEDLLERLDQEAHASHSSVTALAATLLDEGLKTRRFPGVVYREGPAGRRAGVIGGPDVWEIVRDVRNASGAGERRLQAVAKGADLSPAQVRLAVDFYAAHPAEIDDRINADDKAAERVRRQIEVRERLLAQ
jgi:predicted transcriptional regulator